MYISGASNEKPLVSVVIPTYNRANELRRAITSLLSQTYANWEALVIDNESDDITDLVVASFRDNRIKLSKISNKGVIAASRNLGIKKARGEYIAFLDSDDWWKPEKLEESVKHLNLGSDIVYHSLFIVKNTTQIFFFRRVSSRQLIAPAFVDLIMNGNGLINSSVVCRKNILEQIGGLSENSELISMEDYDAWLKVSKITDKFKKIPLTLGYYWLGGGNSSSPAKTIKGLKAIEELYADEIRQSGNSEGPWWMNYGKGRSFFIIASYPESLFYFRKISVRDMKLSIGLKIAAMSIVIYLNAWRGQLRRFAKRTLGSRRI